MYVSRLFLVYVVFGLFVIVIVARVSMVRTFRTVSFIFCRFIWYDVLISLYCPCQDW